MYSEASKESYSPIDIDSSSCSVVPVNIIITLTIEDNLTVEQIDELRMNMMQAVEDVTDATYGLQIPAATW